MPEEINEIQRGRLLISPKEIVFKYLRYLPWVIVSVVLMCAGAYIKLRYSIPIYNVSGKLLVTSQSPYSNGGEKFDDIFMMQKADKISDEIEIIKSRSVAARVIRTLGLQIRVYNKGKIRSSIIHLQEAPFNFELISLSDSSRGIGLLVNILDDNRYSIGEQSKIYSFNETVNYLGATFRLIANNNDLHLFSSNAFLISWTPIENMAASLSSSMAVNRVNDFTNVLNLSYQTENIKLGVDIVNQYMKEYQQSSLEDKREIAAKALKFIDEQLDTVFHELGGVEKSLLNYREKNRVFNPQAQTELFFGELSESNKELVQQGINLKKVDYLSAYISDQKNPYKIIPSMLGIEEPALLQQVTEFNKLQLERESMLKNTGTQNPNVLTVEGAINKLRGDMIETLKNIRQTYVLTLNELQQKNRQTDKVISSIPSKEKQLLEVTRQQNILQELYSYLLQKKLETAIASASTISNIKVVEPAMASGAPVSPNKKGLYVIAILLGILIPVGIVFLKEYLNDKVKTKQEIQQMTEAPILGEIGHADEANTLVVTSTSRKLLAEQFRIVRSNIQYILPKVDKPAILVTSSFSGEGKSFISTNLGSVLALSGKRTVILEFDIRKPKIMKGLGLHERKGITNYIVGSINVNDVIYPIPDVENLYVIPCGPVPPNPAEMLLSERVGQLFAELRKLFDVIIIDSAPVGLVSDAITLGKHADAAIYIVRHNYTLKKQIQLIDEIYLHKKLPHISIIINDINVRAGYGGYYGYGNYGYGYGYGSRDTSGYFESSNGTPKRSRWHSFFSKSRK